MGRLTYRRMRHLRVPVQCTFPLPYPISTADRRTDFLVLRRLLECELRPCRDARPSVDVDITHGGFASLLDIVAYFVAASKAEIVGSAGWPLGGCPTIPQLLEVRLANVVRIL